MMVFWHSRCLRLHWDLNFLGTSYLGFSEVYTNKWATSQPVFLQFGTYTFSVVSIC